MGSYAPCDLPHIAIFPFMSKGHTIPLLHLAHLIHRRRLATLTFFTTPLNAPFLRHHLSGTDSAIVQLPFPQNIPGLPDGIESTDALPSISLFLPFVSGIEKLRADFEQELNNMSSSITFLISDGFLGWTKDSAAKFGIPRMVFYGMGSFAKTVSTLVSLHRPHADIVAYNEPFPVPGFPNLCLTKADLSPPFDDPNAIGPHCDFVSRQAKASGESSGLVINTFYELEAGYQDCWNSDIGPKGWCVGPLCLARPPTRSVPDRPGWMQWLDARSDMNRPVLYVAFGTQADVSTLQLKEISAGLEQSGVDFLWMVRAKGCDLGKEFEKRVEERGLVVREWVDQMEILRHESVRGFLSHCGWNSVMETVSVGVPILAMPMMAEQHLNAKFVVEVVGAGLRVQTVDGTRDGLVNREEITIKTRELLSEEKGKVVREKAKDLANKARKAMENDGSSISMLEQMINEMSKERENRLNALA